MRHFVLFAVLFASLGAYAQEQRVDPTFRLAATNIFEVRAIALLPDGSIAYGANNAIGLVDASGEGPEPRSNAIGINVTSLAVDKDLAVLGTGNGSRRIAIRMVAGRNDPAFTANLHGTNFGEARHLFLQNAERDLLLAGDISGLRGAGFIRSGLLRLKRTGETDLTFDVSGSEGLSITAAALDATGAILASYEMRDSLERGFGRWFVNGARDTNFAGRWVTDMGTNAVLTVIEKAPGTNGFLAAVETESGGANGTSTTRLVRLDESGGPIGTSADLPTVLGKVNAIAFESVLPETLASSGYDRILIAGQFTHAGNTPCNNLAAIGLDGAVAWCFGPNEGPEAAINAIRVQLDGKVLIGGAFTNVSGLPAKRLARLTGNSDSGSTYLFWADSEFRAFEKNSVGDLVLIRTGSTSEPLQVNVSLDDTTIGTHPDITGFPRTVHFAAGATQATVRVELKNDTFREGSEVFRFSVTTSATNALLTRSTSTLVVLDDETPGTLNPVRLYERNAPIRNFALQPDGRILVNTEGTTLVRLNPDGSLDETFVTNGIPTLPGEWLIHDIQPQADGKIYVAGFFDTPVLIGRNHLTRLNNDGTEDLSFDPQEGRALSGPLPQVLRVRTFPNGELLTIDRGQQGAVMDIVFRAQDGVVFRLVRGMAVVQPLPRPSVDVLEDRQFVASNGQRIYYGFDEIARVPFGGSFIHTVKFVDELWVGGKFQEINGVAVTNLARLILPDGIVDTNFPAVVDDEVTAIEVHDGKVYIAGAFTKVNGHDRFRIARLDFDGSLDMSFDPGLGPNIAPGKIVVESDGGLLTGMNFDLVDRMPTPPLVRLEGDAPFSPGNLQVRGGDGEIVITYDSGRLQSSEDLQSWREMHSGGGEFTPAPALGREFYRVAF